MTTPTASDPIIRGNTTTTMPLTANYWAVDPIGTGQHSMWRPGQYDPFSGDPQLRRRPIGSDMPQMQGLMDGEGFARSLAIENPYLPSLSPDQDHGMFTPETSSYPARGMTLRPASDQSPLNDRRQSYGSQGLYRAASSSRNVSDYDLELTSSRSSNALRNENQNQTRRRGYNHDEFDGPSQQLPLPLPQQEYNRSQILPLQPINLTLEEQDEIITRSNDVLSQCAYHFVAKYQFPVPIERDKPRVRGPSDREWSEWAHLLKRLATKRRIPARVLLDNQIRQLVTTLENSVMVRDSAAGRTEDMTTRRSPRDDRYMLQIISSGIQVARLLVDSLATRELDELYSNTEAVILTRRTRNQQIGFGM